MSRHAVCFDLNKETGDFRGRRLHPRGQRMRGDFDPHQWRVDNTRRIFTLCLAVAVLGIYVACFLAADRIGVLG